MAGFVKLSSDLERWAWINDPKTVYIYVRLLLGAAWQETDIGNVHLRRGEIAISQRDFATQCLVTRQELRTALNRLTSTQKITQRVERKVSIITLCEYDCDTLTATQTLTKNQPNDNPPTLLNTKEQNNKNPEIRAPAAHGDEGLSERFDKFWSAYPKKTAKQNALKAWEKLKPDEGLTDTILSALERFKQTEQWRKDNGQFIPYPATWLNGRRWEDETTEVNSNGKNSRHCEMPTTESEWLEGFE